MVDSPENAATNREWTKENFRWMKNITAKLSKSDQETLRWLTNIAWHLPNDERKVIYQRLKRFIPK